MEPLTAKEAVWNAVQAAFDWAKDQPLTDDLPAQVTARVQASLDALADDGVIRRGSVELDPARNPPVYLKAGRLSLDFTIEGDFLNSVRIITPELSA